MAVSLKPSTAEETSGLLDDFDGQIISATNVMTDFKGASPEDSPALKVVIGYKDEEGADKTWDALYSWGKAADWRPSKDGESPSEEGQYLVAVGTRANPNSTCNAMLFLDRLVKAEFSEDNITDSVSFLAGISAHFKREKVERDFKDSRTVKSGPGPLFVVKYYGGGAGATSDNGQKSSPKDSKSESDPVKSEALDIILEILAENNGSIAKSKLSTAYLGKITKKTNKAELLRFVSDSAIRTFAEIKVEGNTISIA